MSFRATCVSIAGRLSHRYTANFDGQKDISLFMFSFPSFYNWLKFSDVEDIFQTIILEILLGFLLPRCLETKPYLHMLHISPFHKTHISIKLFWNISYLKDKN